MFSSNDDKNRKIQELKSLISTLAPTQANPTTHLTTRLPALDERIDGWPSPGLTEISGPIGSGRISLCLPSLEYLTQHQRIAIVDPLLQLYPPGLGSIHLENLLILQPPIEQTGWGAAQLTRSGCFALVAVLDPPRLGRASYRLKQASEQGRCPVLLWVQDSDPAIPAKVRIQICERRQHAIRIHLRKKNAFFWVNLRGTSNQNT